MALNPFYILLSLLIFIPQLLGFIYIPYKITLFFLTSFMVFFFVSNHFRKNSLLRYTLIVIALIFVILNWFKNFSLNNLPFLLFLVSDWFIVFLLPTKDSFRKFLYLSLLSFLNIALISAKFNTLTYGIILFLYLFLENFFFLLLTAEAYKEKNPKLFKELFKYSVLSYTLIFLFGIVLFFILPRPQYPLFALLQRNNQNPVIGFSSDIKLGAFSKIAADNSVVFRAKVAGLKPSKALYWRGNTLEIYLNNAWYSTDIAYASVVKWRGKPYNEEELVSPYGGKSVFSYGYPYKVEKSSAPVGVVNYKGILIARNFIFSPLKVSFIAYPSQEVRLLDKRFLLKYPKKLKPLFEQIVKEYNLRGKSFGWILKGVGAYFSRFKYSLNNKAKNLEEFLTVYREGNCEYFASAAALLFRYLGYPTRVVVGFYGGEYNPITGYWVVRQKDAHAWIEIYYNHRWIPFDATKYALNVNPQEQNISEKEQINELQKNRFALLWDTLNTYWLSYVVNLNREKQKKLISNIVNSLRNFHLKLDKKVILISLIGFGSVIILLFWKVFLLIFYVLWLKVKYGIPFKIFYSFVGLYNFLWKYYPAVWNREKNKLKIAIKLTTFKVLPKFNL